MKGKPRSIQSAADIARISRQPIYDVNRNLFAYELLYRNRFDTSESLCGDESTAEVLRTFMEVGLDRIVGNSPAFVNMTRRFILGDYRSLLPRDRVVLEVLESVTPDEAVIGALSKLRAEGYRIALDDFVFSEDKRPLLELAHFVKIDLRMFAGNSLIEQLEHLKPYKAQLLAEKIETHEEFELARQSGFDYFQGFFLSQPRTMKTGMKRGTGRRSQS